MFRLSWFVVVCYLALSPKVSSWPYQMEALNEPAQFRKDGEPQSHAENTKVPMNGHFNEQVKLDDLPLQVDLTKFRNTVDEQFLSVTLDACAIKYNWSIINFKLPRVINMAKALSPAMLRIGGIHVDYLIFEERGEDTAWGPPRQTAQPVINCFPEEFTNFTMNMAQWDAVNAFAEEVGWEMVFGLNDFLRTHWPKGDWDDSNAKKLMGYTLSKGYEVNWELGSGRSSCVLSSEALAFTNVHNVV